MLTTRRANPCPSPPPSHLFVAAPDTDKRADNRSRRKRRGRGTERFFLFGIPRVRFFYYFSKRFAYNNIITTGTTTHALSFRMRCIFVTDNRQIDIFPDPSDNVQHVKYIFNNIVPLSVNVGRRRRQLVIIRNLHLNISSSLRA